MSPINRPIKRIRVWDALLQQEVDAEDFDASEDISSEDDDSLPASPASSADGGTTRAVASSAVAANFTAIPLY